MYKDNGKIDVELLAEVGDIAHRLRSLDERLALNLDDPRIQQELQHCQTSAAQSSDEPPSDHQCTSSERRSSLAAQVAQNIGDRISDASSTAPAPEATQQRRYSSKQVEDIILEFYEQHLIYHQNLEKERLATSAGTETNEPRRSRIYRLTIGDSNNMNNSPSSTANDKCSTSNTGDNIDSLGDGKLFEQITTIPNDSTDESSEKTTSTATTAEAVTTTTASGGKRNSIAIQQMPEIQISNSDEQPKTRKSLTIEQFEQKDSIDDSTSDEKSATHETPTATTTTTASGTGTGGICGHYCAGWQTSIWNNKFDDDVLRKLVMELKHKIEFTERMNWLCKYQKCITYILCVLLVQCLTSRFHFLQNPIDYKVHYC